MESMTVEDLVDRLKAYEIRLRDRGVMTHAEWEAEMNKRGEEDGFKGRGGRVPWPVAMEVAVGLSA